MAWPVYAKSKVRHKVMIHPLWTKDVTMLYFQLYFLTKLYFIFFQLFAISVGPIDIGVCEIIFIIIWK